MKHPQLEAILGVQWRKSDFLTLALTHRSYIYEAAGAGMSSNERLEFLGDSILSLVSADFLYRTYPQLAEGELTDARAVLVRTETLAQFAREIDLGHFLLLGKGEQQSGGSPRVLASAFEAVLGAIYLDQGLEAVREFLLPRLMPIAETIISKRRFKDNKSLFQEMAQAHEGVTPSYRVVNQEGPSHNQIFVVEVLIGEQVAGQGQGRSKQTAEQEAAYQALERRQWL